MVFVGIGSKELKTSWPIEEGQTLGTTKLSEDFVLIPENSLVAKNDEKRLV